MSLALYPSRVRSSDLLGVILINAVKLAKWEVFMPFACVKTLHRIVGVGVSADNI